MPMHEDVLCNWCGETCVIGPEGWEHNAPAGMVRTSVRGHYRSTPGNGYGALDDTTAYKFSLCEFCLDAMFSRFKIPPSVAEYLIMSSSPEIDHGETFRPAEQRVREDDWRRFKEEFFAEKERRDKLRAGLV